jgi:hypothetical protein
LTLIALTGPALAQVGQFPGVQPSVPSPQLGGAPAPPAIAPGPTNLPSGFSQPSRVVTTPRGRSVVVPNGPPDRDTFGDRTSRCIEAGTAAGLSPNRVGSFTRQCAN